MPKRLFAFSLTVLMAGAQSPIGDAIRIPDRAAAPLFKGEPGKQRTEIHFDPATGMVTLKLVVQDPNGYFIPNIRRDNFVVYENGVRQNNATVDIEHAPLSLAMLLENGGRYPALNKAIATEISLDGRHLLDVVGREDKIAIWKYADRPELLSDFTRDHDMLNDILLTIRPPSVSEANLYDAVIAVLQRMRTVAGRKGVIVISSGVDTFSKARYEDVLKAAGASNTPLYAIGLGKILSEAVDLSATGAPAARIDWKRAESELQGIAQASGGRFYKPATSIDLSATYDDIMENLKVRYVITYKSSTTGNAPRKVRVELVDPKTGGPLRIVDASGRTIQAHVVIEDSYVPSKT
jgi:VWFA-related protein